MKQNFVDKLIFFATTYDKDIESARPLLSFLSLLNLMYTLTVYNFYRLHNLKSTPRCYPIYSLTVVITMVLLNKVRHLVLCI